MTIQDRIQAVRRAIADAGVQAVIIPQLDPHQSEYLASHWQARRFLSGFTGSAGTLVVTSNEALLWTDSRYFLQAGLQLEGTGIKLMKEGLPETPDITTWLNQNLKGGDTVGVDGMLYSRSAASALRAALARHDIGLRTDVDILPQVWTDRPALPADPIMIHDVKYAGEDARSKMARIMVNVEEQGADSTFISALDEIAWTLNIRGRDVNCNPVVTSFLYLAPEGTTLFIDEVKLSQSDRDYLAGIGVAVAPYDSVIDFLSHLPQEHVLVVEDRTATRIVEALGARAVGGTSPVALLKACKNATEVAGVRNAMERDGVALVKSFMEIEERLSKGIKLTELDVAEILHRYRSQSPMWVDESFETIAGYGPHGAIVHYEADEESSSVIEPRGLLLVDSGAQYLDGTTDITRTVALGTPTDQERRDYTLVMKGHIALARAIYPEGTRGAQLDALARQFLWNEGLSYLHGTGHGVGFFLNVHEGPQSIRLNDVPTPLMPGMITSDEPGLYREGVHGIRIENLVLTVEKMHTEFGRFYAFETLTLFPYDTRLLDLSIMTAEEVAWLNDYQATVRRRLMPHLDAAQQAWLTAKTEPVSL